LSRTELENRFAGFQVENRCCETKPACLTAVQYCSGTASPSYCENNQRQKTIWAGKREECTRVSMGDLCEISEAIHVCFTSHYCDWDPMVGCVPDFDAVEVVVKAPDSCNDSCH